MVSFHTVIHMRAQAMNTSSGFEDGINDRPFPRTMFELQAVEHEMSYGNGKSRLETGKRVACDLLLQ